MFYIVAFPSLFMDVFMPWNPQIYDQFKAERQQPFFDLMAHIQAKPHLRIVDLGCGTGELTVRLAEHFSDADVLGIDSSLEMLQQAPSHPRVHFEHQNISDYLATGEAADVLVANASLQWLDQHAQLWPQLRRKLRPHGQLAIQMPNQAHNCLNQLLSKLAQQPRYAKSLQHWHRPSSVLDLDDYAQILFAENAIHMTLYQKVYPQIAASHDDLYQFIAGSALIPYLEHLPQNEHAAFIADFKHSIANAFPQLPALYAFKRLIMHAQFV